MNIFINLISNPNKIEFNESNPYILVVSDIHFGAHNSKSRDPNAETEKEHVMDFIKLLKKINKNKDKLKGLVILGDFLDLVMTTYKKILRDDDFKNICKYFNRFNSYDIPIILALGNHEISVSIDDDISFSERIGNFKSNFKQLHYITFCQGLYIRKPKDNSILPQFEPFNEFNDENLQSIQENDFILMHGFQFNRDFYRNKVSKDFWNPLQEEQDTILKEMINLLYNYYLFEEKSMKDIKNHLNKYFEEIERKGDRWFENKSKLIRYSRIFKVLKKLKLSPENNNGFNRRIKKYLARFITERCHLIYGHTHNIEENLEKGNYLISNCGAWLNKNPSYIKIYLT